MGVKFDFDEIGSNEFDSDWGDAESTHEGDDSNFGFEHIYRNSSTVNNFEEVPPIGSNTGHKEGNKDSKNGIGNNTTEMKSVQQFGTVAVVTEFLFKLFPGRSIFLRKRNLWGIVAVQHKYLSMFVNSTVTKTRTIRFFNVLSLILTSVFADTVFFGIFYPAHSACSSMTDKVNQIPRFSLYNATSVIYSNPFPCIPKHLYYVFL